MAIVETSGVVLKHYMKNMRLTHVDIDDKHLTVLPELQKYYFKGRNLTDIMEIGKIKRFKYSGDTDTLVFVFDEHREMEDEKMGLEIVKEKVKPSEKDIWIARQNALTQANNWFAHDENKSSKNFFEFAEMCEKWVFR